MFIVMKLAPQFGLDAFAREGKRDGSKVVNAAMALVVLGM